MFFAFFALSLEEENESLSKIPVQMYIAMILTPLILFYFVYKIFADFFRRESGNEEKKIENDERNDGIKPGTQSHYNPSIQKMQFTNSSREDVPIKTTNHIKHVIIEQYKKMNTENS
jgi:hypothetical protein